MLHVCDTTPWKKINRIASAFLNGYGDKYPSLLRSEIPLIIPKNAKYVELKILTSDGAQHIVRGSINTRSQTPYRIYLNGAKDRAYAWDLRWGLPTRPKRARGGAMPIHIVAFRVIAVDTDL